MSDNDEKYWNLDLFFAKEISRLISEHLVEFAKKTHSRPMEYTDDSWDAKLKSIATRLEAYHTYKFELGLEKEKVLTESAQEAIRELADIFPSLWD